MLKHVVRMFDTVRGCQGDAFSPFFIFFYFFKKYISLQMFLTTAYAYLYLPVMGSS